jgi:hypothetical protein
MGGGGGDAHGLHWNHLQVGLRQCNHCEYLSVAFDEVGANVLVVLAEKGASVASVGDAVVDDEVDQCDFYAIFIRNGVSSSQQFDHASLPLPAVPLNSVDESGSVRSLMAIRVVFDYILGMVDCCLLQSLVVVEGTHGFLVVEEGLGLFPGRLALNALVIDIVFELHVELIHEGA